MNRMRVCAAFSAGLIVAPAFSSSALGQCQNWDTAIGSPGAQLGEPGYDTVVRTLEIFDDGSGPALYAGGSFTMMGGTPAYNIARWNGTQWSPVGGGLTSFQSNHATVYDLQAFDDGSGPALYAVGWFDRAGGQPASSVARWNGTSWQTLSSFTNGLIYKMAVIDGALYLGGNFREINGTSLNTLVKWDGQAWTAVPGAPTFSVGGSAVWGFGQFASSAAASIFVGGMELVPATPINQIDAGTSVFQFSSAGWTYPGYGLQGQQVGGVSSGVTAFEVFDDGSGAKLYAGGLFDHSGLTGLNHLAKFDGQRWTDVGGGVALPPLTFFTLESGPTVWDLAQHAGKLYLGGGFTRAGGARALWLASWNGHTFDEPAGGTNDTVYDLQVFDDGRGPAIFVAGSFTRVDPTGANLAAGGIARLACHAACYANCDGSAAAPFLNVQDFTCFLQRYAAGESYANCDRSTAAPVLNVQDFTCFLQGYAAGCP
jgi:trimeric autotransporter adhesin